jgi:hypothetical protein
LDAFPGEELEPAPTDCSGESDEDIERLSPYLLENFGVVVRDRARFRYRRAVSKTERGALKTIFEHSIVPYPSSRFSRRHRPLISAEELREWT